MEGPTKKMLDDLNCAQLYLQLFDWEKKRKSDGSFFYRNKRTGEITQSPDVNYLVCQKIYDAAREAVDEARIRQVDASNEALVKVLESYAFKKQNLSYEHFEDICHDMDCWKFVPEQDRRDIFAKYHDLLLTYMNIEYLEHQYRESILELDGGYDWISQCQINQISNYYEDL